jgi:tetratricopeptide (TPR) repeat protein
MNTTRLILLAVVVTGTLAAQRHKLVINAETPEGQQLQQIGQEQDAGKKLALMEDFLAKHPKHEGSAWVLEQVMGAYLAANSFDKALDAGQKLLAMDPNDVATSHNCLKAAEGKKDPDAIKQWAASTSALARKVAATPKPADDEAAEEWKANVDYAKQVDTYTEYALYVAALGTADPAKRIGLIEALQAQSPNSQYVPQLDNLYFLALRQAQQNDKAIALAEKVLEREQTNEDMLLAVADNYYNKKTNPDKVIAYGNKLAELMDTKPKPEGVADADWEKRKTLMKGMGYWMAGMTYANQNKHAETDRELRKALPLVKENDQLAAQTLFYLALANYRMGDPKKDKKLMSEALRFNTQCAAIKSPFQATAQKNAAAIRAQYGLK